MSYEPKQLCSYCGESKYALSFQNGKCEDCHLAYHRNWRASAHGQSRIKHHNWKAQHTKRAMVLLSAAKSRARKRGVPFAVSAEERARLQAVIDAGTCELTGLPFNMERGEAFYADSPSIDRITPSAGYVDGNLRVILYGLNAALGSWGEAKLFQMVEAWQTQRKS